MGKESLQVAILEAGDRSWVAGSIYTANLIRALRGVQNETGVNPILLQRGYKRDSAPITDLKTEGKYLFSTIEGDSSRPVCRWIKKGVSWVRRPGAHSLESILRQTECGCIFPAPYDTFDLPCPGIHWIPDFQYLHFPQFFPGRSLEETRFHTERILSESRHILLSSEDAAEDVRNSYPEHGERCTPIPFVLLPEESWFSSHPAPVLKHYKMTEPYLIFPSSFWRHKGHFVLFRALEILRENHHLTIPLLCPGFREDLRDPTYKNEIFSLIRELHLEDQVSFPGLLPRQELIQLIRGARAVVQPSFFEGWSALLEEAQLFGKPSFASDLPVHVEQAAEGARFFPSGDADALANRIASEWESLPGGLDSEREEAGRTRQYRRGREYGLQLAHYLRSVAEEH